MAKKKTKEEIDQLINQLRQEKRELVREEKKELKKKRNHMMIVVGAQLLTHYPGKEEVLINLTDEEIKAWVDSLFRKSSGQ